MKIKIISIIFIIIIINTIMINELHYDDQDH